MEHQAQDWRRMNLRLHFSVSHFVCVCEQLCHLNEQLSCLQGRVNDIQLVCLQSWAQTVVVRHWAGRGLSDTAGTTAFAGTAGTGESNGCTQVSECQIQDEENPYAWCWSREVARSQAPDRGATPSCPCYWSPIIVDSCWWPSMIHQLKIMNDDAEREGPLPNESAQDHNHFLQMQEGLLSNESAHNHVLQMCGCPLANACTTGKAPVAGGCEGAWLCLRCTMTYLFRLCILISFMQIAIDALVTSSACTLVATALLSFTSRCSVRSCPVKVDPLKHAFECRKIGKVRHRQSRVLIRRWQSSRKRRRKSRRKRRSRRKQEQTRKQRQAQMRARSRYSRCLATVLFLPWVL